jgi:hypothetical protein
MAGNTGAPDAIGEPVTELDEFWLETARTAVRESVASLEEAAKQLIGAVTLVEGIYFAAISFSDLKEALAVQDLKGWFLVLLFVSPIVFWLISLAYAVRVFAPQTYRTNLQSPDLAKEMLMKMVAYKHQQLRRAHAALLLGFGLMMANIVIYLGWMPKVAS